MTGRAGTRVAKEARARKKKLREELLEKCLRRIAPTGGREMFREVLNGLMDNSAIPPEALSTIPGKARKVGKSRFEQLYDACMFLAFPDYREGVVLAAFGPGANPSMKFWRAMFPRDLGLSHVIIRATSFQEAFGLACDYACRLSMQVHRRIPHDMTVRVQFMPDMSAARMMRMRHSVRNKTRRSSRNTDRTFSQKQIHGSRLVAVGPRGRKDFSIFWYAEKWDVRGISKDLGRDRISAVETETFRPKGSPGAYGGP